MRSRSAFCAARRAAVASVRAFASSARLVAAVAACSEVSWKTQVNVEVKARAFLP